MTVKVTMTRQVTPGRAYELYELPVELRSRALKRPGYLSGETLVLASDPDFHMVVGNRSSLREWRDRESHIERLEMIRRIDTLLTATAKAWVCLELGESLSGV